MIINRIALKNSKIIIALAIFSLIGVSSIIASRASTPSSELETENGVLSEVCANVVNDTLASGQKSIQFKCPDPTTGFVHPGILVSKNHIDFVKSRLTQEPWKSALTETINDYRAKKPTQQNLCLNYFVTVQVISRRPMLMVIYFTHKSVAPN